MKPERICLIGGTGFVGRHLVARLARAGLPVRTLARQPHRHRDLGVPRGNEVVAAGDFRAPALAEQMAGCDTVINLIGILNEDAKRTFRSVHVELAEAIVEGAKRAGANPSFLARVRI